MTTEQHQYQVFEQEFMPHADALYNFAFYLARDEQDANDLLQETLMKAFRAIDSYEEGSNARAWLFRILRNNFINRYRKRSRGPAQVDYEENINYQQEDNDTLLTGHRDLREEMFGSIMGDEITNAVNSLKEDFRTVILLVDVEDFTYEEVANIVDVPIGTVRSRLHRGRAALREKLAEYGRSKGYGLPKDEEE